MYDQVDEQEPREGHVPWNKGRLTGQKRPFTLRQIWEIRIRLQLAGRVRELALFNLGIDSKLRACDLVRLRVTEVAHGAKSSLAPQCSRRRLGDRSPSS
jgi:hypothetical protein